MKKTIFVLLLFITIGVINLYAAEIEGKNFYDFKIAENNGNSLMDNNVLSFDFSDGIKLTSDLPKTNNPINFYGGGGGGFLAMGIIGLVLIVGGMIVALSGLILLCLILLEVMAWSSAVTIVEVFTLGYADTSDTYNNLTYARYSNAAVWMLAGGLVAALLIGIPLCVVGFVMFNKMKRQDTSFFIDNNYLDNKISTNIGVSVKI